MSDKPGEHLPVLVQPLLELLDCQDEAVMVDATVGQGGHARCLLQRCGAAATLIGLDVDPDSLAVAQRTLTDMPGKVKLIRENFGSLDDVLDQEGIGPVDLIFADLGVCSAQLADAGRGISFQEDGPLDMRLDQRLESTAADLINRLGQEDLANVIFQYGEERRSRRIARAIVQARQRKPLERTSELVDVIYGALGIRTAGRRSKIHPATRTFQALRIAVNDELAQLERLLAVAAERLKVGGQVAIISFHSLEDRIVKYDFRARKSAGKYDILTRKPLMADEPERLANPRSRSAKLRVARRIAL